MLDEKALRSPVFTSGVPIRLCDGQDWMFPVPRVRFVIDDANEDGFDTAYAFDGEPSIGHKAALDALDSASGGVAIVRATFLIAKSLLMRNYILTPSQLASLVQLSYGENAEPELVDMKDAIMGVAYGRTPKPADVG